MRAQPKHFPVFLSALHQLLYLASRAKMRVSSMHGPLTLNIHLQYHKTLPHVTGSPAA